MSDLHLAYENKEIWNVVSRHRTFIFLCASEIVFLLFYPNAPKIKIYFYPGQHSIDSVSHKK